MTKSTGKRVRRGTRQVWLEANRGCHFCQCGCGQPIEIRVEHFGTGVPTYRLGHNPHPKAALPERIACQCGCGALAVSGKRFLNGHNGRGVPRTEATKAKISEAHIGERNPQFGNRPHNYKGRTYHGDGYVMVHAPGHPFSMRGTERVMEHRLIVEVHLRLTDPESPYLIEVDGEKYLRRDLEVHHVDGVKDHNVIENLMVLTPAEHTRLHHHLRSA